MLHNQLENIFLLDQEDIFENDKVGFTSGRNYVILGPILKEVAVILEGSLQNDPDDRFSFKDV
jgi:hypothetical protein